MRRFLFIPMLAALMGLASCSKDDNGLQRDGDVINATFDFSLPPITRAGAADGITRYIVEAYKADNVSGVSDHRVEAGTGSVTITLDKDTEYLFLFWADNGTANENTGTYNATSLKDVKPNTPAAAGTRAFYGSETMLSSDVGSDTPITLGNAVAEVNFVETDKYIAADNTLNVIYPHYNTFNVADGSVTKISTSITRTFDNIEQVAAETTIATDYIFAPKAEKELANISVRFNNEETKEIGNVPFQTNYRTNIKGEYSSVYGATFTVSNDVSGWEGSEDKNFE